MDPFEGFYEAPKSDPRSGRLISVAHRLLARTAIENPTETVEQQQLYSLKVLEEGGVEYTTLAGVVTVDPPEYLSTDAQAAFVDLFIGRHLAGPLMELTIGKAKTRGLGAIQLEVSEDEPKELLPPLEERLEKLQEMWRKVHPEERETTVFTLTLHSDAIILDHLWRFVSVIDQEMLTREIQGFPSCTLRPSYFTRTRLVSGWNAAHRMPKDDELAIQKGAAFLYGTGVSTKNLLPWLHALEESGIGERRSEGFGQVVACHPFHWQGVRT
jgi:CRISPR-associated protein Csx10